jgi:N-acyl-D-amino-acid deacylase
MKRPPVCIILAICLWWLVSPVSSFGEQFDLLILNGRIVDGTGAPWYQADVGIRDGCIVAIGRLQDETATRTLDAANLIVAPGFVDMMGQTANPLLLNAGSAANLLSQGITTINAGEGASAAPLSADEEVRFGWQGMADYFQLLDQKGLPVNVVQTIGHTQVRRLVLGDVDRRPTPDELRQMEAYVEEAMQAGAIGVSTALIYPPAVFAESEEIAALAAVAARYGGRYYTHMRNEGDLLLPAIDEALEIGQQSSAPVHIFHLKAAGRKNWGSMPLAIARIKQARATGQQVTADVYPYIHNGLGIAAFIHPRHFAEGREKLLRRLGNAELRAEIREEMETTSGWENWYQHAGAQWDRVIIGQAANQRYQAFAGASVAEIADALHEDPWDTFFALVQSGAFALPESMTEANKILAMQQEFVSFCTDVGPDAGTGNASHPRGYGAFPRLLSRYVRDLGALSLERAVAQASAAATNNVLAYDRGRISTGLAADVIVFDDETIRDAATFAAPHEIATGMRYVIVNGELVWDDGQQTDKRPGRVLRGPGFDAAQSASRQITGSAVAGFDAVEAIVAKFIAEHRIPGLSIAVAHHDEVIYARGFGFADVGRRVPVQPSSRFRIASVSKPITAVAILQLVEQQRLDLDASVFGILRNADGTPRFHYEDERATQITVRHLLQHRGGWDRDKSFDAMFQSVRFAADTDSDPPAGPEQVIEAMQAVPLDFAPGERYAYSNFGYCLLGRVIEQVTGAPYAEYVQQHVLLPAGAKTMAIGRSRLEDRQEDEVRYYDPGRSKSVFAADLNSRVPATYGAWYLEAMDSHGAWIGTATDVVRFAAACDPASTSPLLQPSTWAMVAERPPGAAGENEDGAPKDSWYGLGWSVRRDKQDGSLTLSHSGSLPGTNTRLIRQQDGTCIAILCNARVSTSAASQPKVRVAHMGRRKRGQVPKTGTAQGVLCIFGTCPLFPVASNPKNRL